MIQLLKERLAEKDEKIKELQTQSPDALASALSSRIELTLKEIARLRSEGDEHQKEVAQKEGELQGLKARLSSLSALILDTDLVCKKCGTPLNQRALFPIHGHIGDREVEAEGEYTEYECGLAVRNGEEFSPCTGET